MMKMRLALFSLVLLIAGCSNEQLAFTGLLVGQSLDAYTTIRHIDAGGREMNPLLGGRPDAEDVVLFKAGTTLLFLGLAEIDEENEDFWLWLGASQGLIAAGINQYHWENR